MAERWRVELLDRSEVKQGDLLASSGKLSWSIFKAVPGSGDIDITRDRSEIDLLNDRIRIVHERDGVETPVGMWLLSVGGWRRKSLVTTTTCKLLDKTELLNAPVGAWLTLPAGTTITAQVEQIIMDRGEASPMITPSDRSLSVAMSWEPQDTWLTVANDLLRTANHGALWADSLGRLRSEPYVEPERREVVATYGASTAHSPLLPEWDDDAEIWSLPTGFRLTVAGTDEQAGIIGVADLPDDHPLSAASRGRELLATEDGEAADQATADAIAARRLQEALQVTRRATITHPIDSTEMNDVVVHDALGLRGPIVERELTLGLGAVVTDTIRHIYTGGDLPWQ